MRWTETLIPTLKETPEGAEIPSHVLMLRAGMIHQVMAGVYTYLPLGIRALHKAAAIVRQEMNRCGASEVLMPALTPISLWERTGRVAAFGDVLMQFKVRRRNHEVHLALGPTHEEVVTELVARFVNSYRQLPVTLYQIQTKFRNEERPRFGVLRTSEFLMKDAYSFDASVEGLQVSYQKMYDAYCRILQRCGLKYLAVEAESGPIGGDASHEFMVLADNGEDSVLYCEASGYAANVERAEIGRREAPPEVPLQPLTKVDTPSHATIEQVSQLLGVRPRDLVKTLIYEADGAPVAVLIRGDHEANEAKIRRALGVQSLELASPEVIQRVTGAPVGFAGPVGLKIPIWADHDARGVRNAVVGANEADKHYTGANVDRDFRIDHVADLRNAADGDPCPRSGQPMRLRKAIEVGHVFKLGTKYSEALGAYYLDDKEQQHPIIMGCYGIGVNRILAAAIETSHDADGVIWPISIAPFEVILSPIGAHEPQVAQTAAQLHDELAARGVDVLLDDRDQRPGVKFKDADLIGIPLRVVIGGRSLKAGQLEIKWRWEKEPQMLDLDGAAERIAGLVQAQRDKLQPAG